MIGVLLRHETYDTVQMFYKQPSAFLLDQLYASIWKVVIFSDGCVYMIFVMYPKIDIVLW